ncbi:hypothetical protein BCR43DRAFT_484190 [Syncephalastrum racemosum]|uniref:Uncharacterized protein n=1 Tax=Syncephalastrum racemosum TaxID=13706 RepID=A0A1X2HWK5_SYNRA|nr:hypothetical protein BCR43DRAFT_484190 [Syncephalastrum racemosum]
MDPNDANLWSAYTNASDGYTPDFYQQQPQAAHPQPQPPPSRNSLSDIGVGEILEKYQHDSELLKHILIAKAEEDKVP